MHTRIKICGLRNPADARVAAQAGADAIGLVFHSASPRAISPDEAREIVTALPAFVSSVALFMDAGETEVGRIIDHVRPSTLQFHGAEPADFCRSFGLPYVKAVPMGGEITLEKHARDYADAAALLLDSHAPGAAGGSGKTFDWSAAEQADGPPIIVAGGLTPENVGNAIAQLRPYGVDVSSGVESPPGTKNAAAIRAFCEAVSRADSGHGTNQETRK